MDNFVINLILSTVNECPDNSSCKSFQDIYRNETYFCENVWRSDYKVVAKDSSKPCFKFEFEDKNPNTLVRICLVLYLFN